MEGGAAEREWVNWDCSTSIFAAVVIVRAARGRRGYGGCRGFQVWAGRSRGL